MNKKIKVIELLNKIANGEEVPKRIKLYSNVYTLKSVHETPTYYDDNDKTLWDGYNSSILNDEVEILEDNTEEIEELPDYNYSIKENRDKINELIKRIKYIERKINE